jgi:predicted dehydrogenase
MSLVDLPRPVAATARAARPRIGFLGVGWIGRHRMEAMLETGAVEAAVVADPSPECLAQAVAVAPDAETAHDLDVLLDIDLDGVVIATPSALHAEQAIACLERGLAVFCQKPLGRTEAEVRAVVDAARANDRLLAVDLSYRFTEGARAMREAVRAGEIGRPFAADLVFHNVYGPDKAWFYDPALAGGGCVMDLGVHLADLALWLLDFPEVQRVSSSLFAAGEPLAGRTDRVEDYAVATLELASGATVRLACSWRVHGGQDAAIGATLFGTDGGLSMQNVNGSFYDFETWRFQGATREQLSSPPDAWGGRAAADWAQRLAAGERFDAQADRLIDVARVLDRVYGR